MSLRDSIPLQKRKVVKKSLGGMIVFLIFAGFVILFFGGFFFAKEPLPGFLESARAVIIVVVPLFLVLIFLWIPVYHYIYWKRYFYDMDDANIVIRKGVIAQKEITLPFSRITDVYVDQDIFDVMFGLFDVHMSTPTEQSGQFAHIDGVNKDGSRQLRGMILERINKEPS